MFKKLAIFVLFVGIAGVSHAWDFEKNPDRNVYVKYNQTLATALTSTSAIIIDLSDTTNWPHSETRELRISWLRVSMDKAAASTETVKLGVVTEVNATNGDITWFYGLPSSLNVSNTNVVDVLDFQPSWISLKVNVADETTPYILSNDTTANSTDYQNDDNIPTASGTDVPPGVGDVILYVDNTDEKDVTIIVEILYHTVKR